MPILPPDGLEEEIAGAAGPAEEEIPIPAHEVVNDAAGFEVAWQRLRPHHELLCYKPAVIYDLLQRQ